MKKAKTPTAVTSLVFTLITVFFWAAFEIYRAITFKPAPPVPEAIIRPLDPNLDPQILNQIPGRLFFKESDLPNNQASLLAPVATIESSSSPSTQTATPFPSESPVATSSPTLSAVPSPTP